MTLKFFILKNRQVVPATMEEWSRFLMSPERVVAQWYFGDVFVSTAFLGIDHNGSDEGPPLLYETMVFGGPLDQHQERSSGWVEAEEVHEQVCREVRQRALQ